MPEPYEYTEEDKRVIIAAQQYDQVRHTALGQENDPFVLWKIISAADTLRKMIGG